MPKPGIEPAALTTLGADLKTVWAAPTTDARLKKRIVRSRIREVVADIDQEASEIVLIVHWVGGDAPAKATARPAQQRLSRSDHSCPPVGADRQ